MEIWPLDLETTSPNPHDARIVTAYIGRLRTDGALLEETHWLARPEGYQIPAETTAIHGVTTEQALASGASRASVLNEIFGKLRSTIEAGEPIAGHNVSYDLTVLAGEVRYEFGDQAHAKACEIIESLCVLDSLVLDKQLHRFRKGSGARKLVNLAPAYGVDLSDADAHSAHADALASGRIVQQQIADTSLVSLDARALHTKQRAWYAEQAADFEQFLRRSKPNVTLNRAWPMQEPEGS